MGLLRRFCLDGCDMREEGDACPLVGVSLEWDGGLLLPVEEEVGGEERAWLEGLTLGRWMLGATYDTLV